MNSLMALSSGSLPMAALTSSGRTGTGEEILFWVLATVMVIAAFGLLFARKAIYAAMSMVLIMISLAFMYVTQDAPFLGMAQVIVYTGAVMMLFLFVLMLVGVDMSDSMVESIKGQRWIGYLFGIGLAVVLVGVIVKSSFPAGKGLTEANAGGNAQGVAKIIFSDYVFTLEVTGVLLIIAALGAILLTHRERLTRKVGQRERMIERIKRGDQITPMPSPGVYSHTNAADVPALDAHGNPLELSVPQVLRVRGQVRDYRAVETGYRFDEAGEIAETPAEQASEADASASRAAAPGEPTVADAEQSAAAAHTDAPESGQEETDK